MRRHGRRPRTGELQHLDLLASDAQHAVVGGLAQHRSRYARRRRALHGGLCTVAGHGDQDAGGGLGEQRGERVRVHALQVQLRALVGAEQQLEHRLGQAAL